MSSLLDQLYRTKLLLIAVIFGAVGLGLLILNAWLTTVMTATWWLGMLPEIGFLLLGAAFLGIAFEYADRKQGDERADQRFDRAVERNAPAIRKAVFDALAFNANTLKEVTSPENLDQAAVNILGLRLGDRQLASDVYTDIRAQVVAAPERWKNLHASVSLAPAATGPASGHGSMFVATVRWEYRVKPANDTLRFASVADLNVYRQLLRDPTMTGHWYVGTTGGLDPASKEVFELVKVTVEGEARPIRRKVRGGVQTYTADLDLGDERKGSEITVSYTYRALVQRHGHVLYLDLARPTKSLRVSLNYAAAGIRKVNTLDFIASSQTTRVDRSPDDLPAKTVDISFDGWVFPRSGVAFVWVLDDEITP